MGLERGGKGPANDARRRAAAREETSSERRKRCLDLCGGRESSLLTTYWSDWSESTLIRPRAMRG